MHSIANLEHKIREIINNPRKQHALLQNRANWYMLCSCLDTIGDTELCLGAYLTKIDKNSEFGSNFLYIYGALQALFIQQDAINNLKEAFHIPFTSNQLLTEIRGIRNDSIGHPTKRGGGNEQAFNFISRASVEPHGFELITFYKNGATPHFRYVNLPNLIAQQREVLNMVLNDVIKTLRNEEMEHRRKFVGEKLSDTLPPTLHYHFEKIFEAIHRPEFAELGRINVEFVLDCIEQYKAGLQKREIFEAFDSVTFTLELLDYPLQELQSFFQNIRQSRLNDKDAYIFADFAKKQTDQLVSFAKELDEEYSKQG